MGARATLLLLALVVAAPALGQWRGQVALEGRYFFESPLEARQHGANLSLSAEPEFHAEWDDGRQSVTVIPFLRLDQGDPERSHGDLRELLWLRYGDDWELRAGIGKLFWGVTESQHLVDVVNQTDLVESSDGEARLGQPMVDLTLIRDWGSVDLILLPYFRERTFPGPEGRLRTVPRIDPDQARYESPRGRHHLDYALRWSHAVGPFDIGLSHFRGTDRIPLLEPGLAGGEVVLIPYYVLATRNGIDLQATVGAWLWKLEAVRVGGGTLRYHALTAGFEYTLYGLFGGAADLGLLYEFLYDSRGAAALTPFQRDSMIGLRLALNDEASTELLAGLIVDHGGDGTLLTLEGSRRLDDHWKAALRGEAFLHLPASGLLAGYRRDDYLQLELRYYF